MILTEYIPVGDQALQESGFFDQINSWKTHNQNHKNSVYRSDCVSDDDYDLMKSYLEIMKYAEKYGDYKKAFNEFCKMCHILPTGVIITKHELKRGKTDKNSIYVEYNYNTKKITLPDNVTLYHLSRVSGIKKLIPTFKSKFSLRAAASKGYLYDRPRVYFTIRKNMPKFLADYKFNEKVHLYVCKKDIKQVYVDPLVWSGIQGAVYVESNQPIEVQEINNGIIDKILDRETPVEEKELNEFCSMFVDSGLEIIE